MFTSLLLLLAHVDLLFPVPIRFMMSSLNTLGFVDFLLPRPCLALYLPTPASSDSHTTWSAAPTPDIFQPLLQLYCFRSQPWQENWLKWTLKANRKEVSSHLNDVKSILPEQAYRICDLLALRRNGNLAAVVSGVLTVSTRICNLF